MAIEVQAAPRPAATWSAEEPRALTHEIRREIRDLAAHHELLRAMVRNSLQTTYNGTFFGTLWWLLDPLIHTAVYLFFIDVILKRGGTDYPMFVASSVIVWKFFSSSVRNAIGMTVSKSQLMRQVAFPRSVLPLAAVIAETAHFVFGFTAVVAFAVVFGIAPDAALLAALPATVIVFVLALGLAYLFSAVNLLFRDTHALTQYVFQLWFYLSPGLYAITLVPPKYHWPYMLNPFATLLPAYHAALLHQPFPPVSSMIFVAIGSVVTLVVGFAVFVRLQPLFAKVQ
jgi:ABC-type polysaccharide/polyol phosphate export permease